MAALAALVLVDRGALDLDASVATYWPEFAARGKAGIKACHLLSHTSGLSGWDQPVTFEDVYNWEKSTAMLAAQSPWWEPGTASGYHAFTYGHLIGEVIRRITGKRPGEFFAAEIARPLSADFHIGLAPAEFHRVAEMVAPEWPMTDLTRLDPNSVAFKTATGPLLDLNIELSRTERWRRADIGAGNGHGNARSVARIQSVITSGGQVAGVRLLSSKTIDRIFEVHADGIDLVMGIPLRLGVGYGLLPIPQVLTFLPEGRLCTWGGAGGSLVLNDVDRRITVAYVMNKMVPCLVGPVAAELIKKLYDIVNR
jgi:CubicO group peptidase (beta-lactamase class C family)